MGHLSFLANETSFLAVLCDERGKQNQVLRKIRFKPPHHPQGATGTLLCASRVEVQGIPEMV